MSLTVCLCANTLYYPEDIQESRGEFSTLTNAWDAYAGRLARA